MNDIDSAHPATHAFDAMIKAPNHHFALLDNSKVRVLDTKVEPGQRTPVHAHEWPVHLAFLSSGVTRQPLVIPTAFDGEDVAELESPSGGHAPDRATDMILRDAQ